MKEGMWGDGGKGWDETRDEEEDEEGEGMRE